MPSVSQVTTVKGRGEDVLRNLPRWLDSGVDEVVLIDYACPDSTGLRVLERTGTDVRVTVVIVPPVVAGPHFHLTRARNIGALASRHESMLFMDADFWANDRWLLATREKMDEGFGLLVSDPRTADEEIVYNNAGMPFSWAIDGQCLIRNNVFHELHGYAEQHDDWGGESYDLYLRAAGHRVKIGKFDAAGLYGKPHADDLRDRYLKAKFDDDRNTRQARHSQALRKLKYLRRHNRGTPGRELGVTAKQTLQLRLFRAGRERPWRPGEDDTL